MYGNLRNGLYDEEPYQPHLSKIEFTNYGEAGFSIEDVKSMRINIESAFATGANEHQVLSAIRLSICRDEHNKDLFRQVHNDMIRPGKHGASVSEPFLFNMDKVIKDEGLSDDLRLRKIQLNARKDFVRMTEPMRYETTSLADRFAVGLAATKLKATSKVKGLDEERLLGFDPHEYNF